MHEERIHMSKSQILSIIERESKVGRGFKLVDSAVHHGGKKNTFRNGFAQSISRVTSN
jgi:hypothetical protein